MTQDMWVWVLVAVLTATTVALAGALLHLRARARSDLRAARAETAGLAARVDRVERSLTASEAVVPEAEPDYVITEVGLRGDAEPGSDPTPQVGRALFADLVLRETVVKTAGLAHGVRRALTPESRFRVRHAFRRAVRASRKQRRADMREARRRLAADRRTERRPAA